MENQNMNPSELDANKKAQEEGTELTPEELEAKKQEIRDNAYGSKEEEGDVKLPSEGDGEPRVYANNFKSVEELKKGIDNLGSNLPDYVLDGMNDDALEKHYIELRKEFSSRGQNKEEEPKEPNKADDKPYEKLSDDLWSEIKATYNETGDISAEQRAELKKQGFSDAFIDSQKQGYDAQRKLQQVELQSFTDKLYDLSGGKDGYEEIKAWAEENIPANELKAISDMGERNDYNGMLYAMKGIKADYIAANGNTSNRVHGGTGRSGSSESYASQQDYLLDRMSLEYKRNSKYRAKVDNKFKNSSFAS